MLLFVEFFRTRCKRRRIKRIDESGVQWGKFRREGREGERERKRESEREEGERERGREGGLVLRSIIERSKTHLYVARGQHLVMGVKLGGARQCPIRSLSVLGAAADFYRFRSRSSHRRPSFFSFVKVFELMMAEAHNVNNIPCLL